MCTYVCVYKYTEIDTITQMLLYTCMLCMHAYTYTPRNRNIYECVYIYMYTYNIYECIYIYTYNFLALSIQ